jgi:competence protein ComGF
MRKEEIRRLKAELEAAERQIETAEELDFHRQQEWGVFQRQLHEELSRLKIERPL